MGEKDYLVCFDDKKYRFDFEKIFELASSKNTGEEKIDKTHSVAYAPVMKGSKVTFDVESKEDGEVQSLFNDSSYNVRYDFIKMLITTVTSPFVDPSGNLLSFDSTDGMWLGLRLSINTLIETGILVEC